MNQRKWYNWCANTFGKECVLNTRERSLRCFEEATELAQAMTIPKEDVLKIIDHVYSRQKGEVRGEIAGSFSTLLVLCETLGFTAEKVVEEEFERVISTDPDHMRRKHADKIAAGISVI